MARAATREDDIEGSSNGDAVPHLFRKHRVQGSPLPKEA
jgi:hypothetical protein